MVYEKDGFIDELADESYPRGEARKELSVREFLLSNQGGQDSPVH